MRSRAELCADAHRLVERLSDGSRDDEARDALLRELLLCAASDVAPYGRLVRATAAAESDPLRFPALPTDVFRYARVAPHPPGQDVRVFRTSGTTDSTRGQRPTADLSLYDRAARAAAAHALFPDALPLHLVVLAAREDERPDSSLSYMLARFCEWFAADYTYVWRDDRLDLAALDRTLREAERTSTAVALLGTSFAFVHAEDGLGGQRFALPSGSRIMQTGGFKGRSRTVEPDALRAALAARYGVDEAMVVAEYGMTELFSQLYETPLLERVSGRTLGPRRLWVPGWVRTTVVDPERLAPVAAGETGLLRLDDLACADGVCAIQTSDLARSEGDGVIVLGRAEGATPRGCSLSVDATLGKL